MRNGKRFTRGNWIAEFGKQAGLTYLPPHEPAILGDVWKQIIQR
ncbi:hypothetical protein [Bradyrhizobium sp. UFLA05-109]